jgi:hypothetical protein
VRDTHFANLSVINDTEPNMLDRLVAQLVWPFIVALVLNGIAGVCLACLKLAGVLDGSWVWILSPLWIPVAVAALLEAVLLQMVWASGDDMPVRAVRARR